MSKHTAQVELILEATGDVRAAGSAETSPPAHSTTRQTAAPTLPVADRRTQGHGRRPAGTGGRRLSDQLMLPPKRAARVAVDRFASTPLTDDSLLDVREAAAYLKCSSSWIYKRVEDGTLPVTRLNGWGLRFKLADLKKWVGEQGGHHVRAAR